MNDCLCCRTEIRFHLIMDDCVRPIPNNSVPNPVLLSMITDQNITHHLAYYAPVASNSWKNFNSTNSSLNEIPIYSPGSSNTDISIDIDDSVEGFLLVWTQYNYIPDGEHWTIQIRKNNGSTFMNEQQLYCYSNGELRKNKRRISMNDGNGSSPRVVSLCFKENSNAICPNFSIPMNPASSSSYVSHDNITCLTSEMTTSPKDETSSITLISSFTTSSFSTSINKSPTYIFSTVTPSPSAVISDTSSLPTSSSPEPTCTPDNIWPETPIGEIARGTCINGIFNGM